MRHDGTLKFGIGGFFGWLDADGNEVSGATRLATRQEEDQDDDAVAEQHPLAAYQATSGLESMLEGSGLLEGPTAC